MTYYKTGYVRPSVLQSTVKYFMTSAVVIMVNDLNTFIYICIHECHNKLLQYIVYHWQYYNAYSNAK